MKEIITYAYEGEGIEEVYNNGEWLISIKNWREANTPAKIYRLEIHHTTDQQFMLIEGEAALLSCDGFGPEDEIQVTKLERGKVYNVPLGLWFNNLLSKDCKLMYVENSNAGDPPCNSEYREMTAEQKAKMQQKVREVMGWEW